MQLCRFINLFGFNCLSRDSVRPFVFFNSIFFFFCNSLTSLVDVVFLFKRFLSIFFAPFFFTHLNTKSLGVKFFIVKRFLFLDLGYSHYCVLKLSNFLNVFAKKKNLYIISASNSVVSSLVYLILRLKRFSVYKNKGLIFFSRIKYMRLKLGKKQQI